YCNSARFENIMEMGSKRGEKNKPEAHGFRCKHSKYLRIKVRERIKAAGFQQLVIVTFWHMQHFVVC
ncbi:TPA: hypothetical protein ACTW95_005033, partial [Klebsiella quasipneumoniae subsp. similipneumoniae]